MLKALPYLAAFIAVGLSFYSAYKWGYNVARLEQSEDTNKALAKAAQHIIDEQSKLEHIETIINQSPRNKIKSPVLMRTLVRLPKCSGKANCPPS